VRRVQCRADFILSDHVISGIGMHAAARLKNEPVDEQRDETDSETRINHVVYHAPKIAIGAQNVINLD